MSWANGPASRQQSFSPIAEGDPLPPEDRSRACYGFQQKEFYIRRSSELARELGRRTGCAETGWDLAQETVLRFLRLAPAVRAKIANPNGYIWRMSINVLRDWGRKSRAQIELSQSLLTTECTDQVACLEARDTLRRLEVAMGRLKPITREVFLARRLDGLSYAEIAAQTGLSVRSVEWHMSKAIAKIDRLLDPR